MSRLKNLSNKLFLNRFNRFFSLRKKNVVFNFRWNFPKKVMAGLLASVFSMMALFSFFGSSEPELSSQMEADHLTPELGASDDLSMEFDLDAPIPMREPEIQPTVISERKSSGAKAVIRTVSTQPVLKTVQTDSGVKHAVGLGLSGKQGQVQHIQGEAPVHDSSPRQTRSQLPSTEKGSAVWLTGEIEEVLDMPIDGSFRRQRRQN